MKNVVIGAGSVVTNDILSDIYKVLSEVWI